MLIYLLLILQFGLNRLLHAIGWHGFSGPEDVFSQCLTQSSGKLMPPISLKVSGGQ